jgi:hypothetical protein
VESLESDECLMVFVSLVLGKNRGYLVFVDGVLRMKFVVNC